MQEENSCLYSPPPGLCEEMQRPELPPRHSAEDEEDNLGGNLEMEPDGQHTASTDPGKRTKAYEAHLGGECSPCAYFWQKSDGCRWGLECTYCHLCDSDAMRRWKKAKKQRKRAEAAESRLARRAAGAGKREIASQIKATPDQHLLQTARDPSEPARVYPELQYEAIKTADVVPGIPFRVVKAIDKLGAALEPIVDIPSPHTSKLGAGRAGVVRDLNVPIVANRQTNRPLSFAAMLPYLQYLPESEPRKVIVDMSYGNPMKIEL